jgi:hypothetical protein
MTFEEVKEKKHELRSKIQELIVNFQKETGLLISNMNFHSSYDYETCHIFAIDSAEGRAVPPIIEIEIKI